MSETLYRYYERELLFVRQLANDFAQQYPAAAGSLLLEANRSVDPHVERLIESFAFLTARVQQKLDDDFPEMTEALLNVLYPHYLAPIPSLAIVQFDLDHANSQPSGISVPRHSPLHTQKIGEVACRFRTCYPVELWPIEVSYAGLQSAPFPPGLQPPPGTASVLRLHLECQAGFHFADLALDQLRIHLTGDTQLVPKLYELIFNNCLQVEFRGVDNTGSPFVLEAAQCLRQVGFERDQGLLPYTNQSFLGYRLLTEFFAFPEKFMFLDLGGWKQAATAGFGNKVEVVLYLNQEFPSGALEINSDSFRLGCTPVVNLFCQTAEPIPVTHTKSGYRVIPDVHYSREMEVYSVDSVVSADPQSTTEYKPFYAIRHDSVWNQQGSSEAYWYASRRASIERGDEGTDVVLHLTDMNFDPNQPADSVLIVKTTCTNRELARQAATGRRLRSAFELETSAPLRRTRCLPMPTRTLRPPLRRCGHWRLVSHLCLNHLSITDPVEGRAALQEILRLYDFSDSQSGRQLAAVNRQTIEGVTGLSSRYTVGRVGGPVASGFCRGVEVTVELDEQKFVGTGDVSSSPAYWRDSWGCTPRSTRSRNWSPRPSNRAGTRKNGRRELARCRSHDRSALTIAYRVAGGFGRRRHALSLLRILTLARTMPPKRRRSVIDELFEEPYRFEFFQSMRLLERALPDPRSVGREGSPNTEVVRFRALQALTFPPSSIYDLSRPASPEQTPVMTVAFMGLTGPSGVLPRHYTELMLRLERASSSPQRFALRDWFDLFNHRLISLFRPGKSIGSTLPTDAGRLEGAAGRLHHGARQA